jgi:hypothetical protein
MFSLITVQDSLLAFFTFLLRFEARLARPLGVPTAPRLPGARGGVTGGLGAALDLREGVKGMG